MLKCDVIFASSIMCRMLASNLLAGAERHHITWATARDFGKISPKMRVMPVIATVAYPTPACEAASVTWNEATRSVIVRLLQTACVRSQPSHLTK